MVIRCAEPPIEHQMSRHYGPLAATTTCRENWMGKKKIAFVGAGAVGGYTGAHMVAAGEDVTFIDPWPDHVEHMRKHGLRVTHAMKEPEFTVPVRALHITDAQQLAKEKPVDIAFVCMKSYDTAWAATLIRQYLAPDGFVVSLQNCMNEETIAGVVGWGKTLGCIASSITVNLPEPGHIHRGAAKHGAAHTVFRTGEVHGRVTERAKEICRLVGFADSAKVTGNLWGERWSKLVANSMQNGLSACTGLGGGDLLKSDSIRHFSTRLGSEAIRVGQAHGYALEDILHLPPETIARAGEGDEAAMRTCDEQRLKDSKHTAAEQRPSMGQDMQKGRRTEIEFLNGLVVREGEKVGISCRANAVLVDIVKRVEKGELKADPRHITEQRMN
jgi:2-dehydropantoate 2-reductase